MKARIMLKQQPLLFYWLLLDLNVISKYPHLTRDTNVLREFFVQKNHTLKY